MNLLADEEFDNLFETFEYTAFRLEVRERYNPSYERESIARFLAGEPDDLPWMEEWCSMVRSATAEGKRYARVRVIGVPLSDYNRFGLWAARLTTEAGEDIRYLDRKRAAGLPNHDYWLFDSRTLAKMHFDDDDNPLGVEIIDDAAEIVQHNYWRDLAWHRAVRREDFAAN